MRRVHYVALPFYEIINLTIVYKDYRVVGTYFVLLPILKVSRKKSDNRKKFVFIWYLHSHADRKAF